LEIKIKKYKGTSLNVVFLFLLYFSKKILHNTKVKIILSDIYFVGKVIPAKDIKGFERHKSEE